MNRWPVDCADLEHLVVREGRSLASIARELGVHPATIENRARDCGIRSAHTRVRREQLHDAEWLRQQFDAGRTISEVAAELEVAYGTVVNARMRAGLAPRRAPRRTVDVDEVRRRLEAGESQRVIARALGSSSSAISKVVRRHGLEA